MVMRAILTAVLLVLVTPFVLAQTLPTNLTPAQLRQMQQAQMASPSQQQQLRQAQLSSQSRQQVDLSQYIQTQGRSIGRGQNQRLVPNRQGQALADIGPMPFGSNLFDGGYVAQRSDGLNSQYLVAPGDKIAIQMWGAVVRSEVVTVDNQGNIFIPDVGPVSVSNTPAANLNAVVTRNIKRIYPNNVNVYINLLTATPVSVFVTGPVERPGQYAGLASDSILFFLMNAGGIDSERGSYREVSVLRDGEPVITYDIYDFLKEGQLPYFSFKDDDVILVAEQGPVVTVEGAARYPLRFELKEGNRSGSALINYAKPMAKTTHVAITGNRSQGPISVYIPLDEFSEFTVEDGDIVLFNDDIRPNVISVQISGSYEGPSFYSLKRGSRLVDLLNHIPIDPALANFENVYIKRESVVEQQKMLLEQSLQRLERSVFTAPASSNGEASIRSNEARLVAQFIDRAREIEPLGKVVVADNGNIANVLLEQGDEIVIPEVTDLVQVSGEVLMPQAVVFNQNARVDDYIAWSSGYTERADSDQIVVIHANGLSEFVTGSTASKLRPGDQILVLPEVDNKLIQGIQDITQILSQIAITANVALNL